MADNLRLRVVLDLAERVLAPMKRISSSSSDAARALKAAKDRLKELNAQQAERRQTLPHRICTLHAPPPKKKTADTPSVPAVRECSLVRLHGRPPYGRPLSPPCPLFVKGGVASAPSLLIVSHGQSADCPQATGFHHR
mgnify:CR=1 FL=1